MRPAKIDIATGLSLGARTHQQDHLSTAQTDESHAIFLADGVGGGAYGHHASELIVEEGLAQLDPNAPAASALQTALTSANDALAQARKSHPNKEIGATALFTQIKNQRLYWASVGDSLLFRFRGGKLDRLNDAHSLSKGVDNLIALGQIDARLANKLASQSTLTSAVNGTPLRQIDCPENGAAVARGDVIILASDGIETVDDPRIEALLRQNINATAAQILQALLDAVAEEHRPDQDNLSIGVYCVH